MEALRREAEGPLVRQPPSFELLGHVSTLVWAQLCQLTADFGHHVPGAPLCPPHPPLRTSSLSPGIPSAAERFWEFGVFFDGSGYRSSALDLVPILFLFRTNGLAPPRERGRRTTLQRRKLRPHDVRGLSLKL